MAMATPREPYPTHDEIGGILNDLAKYAGWLGRGLERTRVREDVKALTAMFESGCEMQEAVETLETDIGKVPSSQVGGLLRKAIRNLRLSVVEGVDV